MIIEKGNFIFQNVFKLLQMSVKTPLSLGAKRPILGWGVTPASVIVTKNYFLKITLQVYEVI